MRIKPDAFQGSGRYMADCRNMKWAKVKLMIKYGFREPWFYTQIQMNEFFEYCVREVRHRRFLFKIHG